MGNELSLARTETTRQSMLLASSRPGALSTKSLCGDSGKEEDNNVQAQEGQATSYPAQTRKGKKRVAAVDTHRKVRSKGRGQGNRARRTVGGDEG